MVCTEVCVLSSCDKARNTTYPYKPAMSSRSEEAESTEHARQQLWQTNWPSEKKSKRKARSGARFFSSSCSSQRSGSVSFRTLLLAGCEDYVTSAKNIPN